MSDFNYDRMFLCRPDDLDDISYIKEDIKRQMNIFDDEDDGAVVSTGKVEDLTDNYGVSPEEINWIPEQRVAMQTDGILSESIPKVQTPKESGRSSAEARRVAEACDTKSLLTSASLFSQPLTSSEPQTPGITSVVESLPAAAPLAFNQPTPGTSETHPPSSVSRPLPAYGAQEECPPPYEWTSSQTSVTPGVLPQHVQITNAPSARATAGVQQVPQVPSAMFPAGTPIGPAAVFPTAVQKRPIVVQQQQRVVPAFTQALGMSQMVQPFVQPAPSVLPSTTASVQRVKASSPLVGGATVAPTGYVQLLAPVQNIDGSTSYQLVMMPANQLAQAAGTPAQVAQNPGAAAKVSQQLQPQQQQAIQYVWKAPNAKIQPQQMVRSPQLVAPQYASIAGQTQGFALVSPAGQQQCVMAVNANQVYQLQQTYPRQQMQPQPSPGRPVIFTGQHPQQQVLATPVMQSTTSLMPF